LEPFNGASAAIMIKTYKKFLMCRRYEKDIWGYIIAKHKKINLARIKTRPNPENLPHMKKKKRFLQDILKPSKFLNLKDLSFSFEIARTL